MCRHAAAERKKFEMAADDSSTVNDRKSAVCVAVELMGRTQSALVQARASMVHTHFPLSP